MFKFAIIAAAATTTATAANDAAAAAAAAMAGEAFIPGAAESASLTGFGMPASLTGMEGEGMGYKTMGYRRKLYNKFAGCDCGESEGEGEGEGMGYKTMGYRKLYNKFADCDCSGAEGAEPTSLPSGMNYGIPADLPRRQLYNNNDDAAAAAAAAMAGGAFIPEAAEPTQLPSAINFGMPASLTGMEGEGEGMGSGDRKLAVQNTLGGKCDLVTNCGTANGKVLSCTVQLFGVGKCVVYQGRTWNEQ